MDGQVTGTVKWFSRMKGWGFIEPDQGERDVFVHYESIVGEGFRNLEKGERVQFRVLDTPKGPKATDVSTLEAGAEEFSATEVVVEEIEVEEIDVEEDVAQEASAEEDEAEEDEAEETEPVETVVEKISGLF